MLVTRTASGREAVDGGGAAAGSDATASGDAVAAWSCNPLATARPSLLGAWLEASWHRTELRMLAGREGEAALSEPSEAYPAARLARASVGRAGPVGLLDPLHCVTAAAGRDAELEPPLADADGPRSRLLLQLPPLLMQSLPL